MQDCLDRLLSIEPRHQFVDRTKYLDNFAVLHQEDRPIKYRLSKHDWPVYQRLLLFIMAMYSDNAMPLEIACSIASLSFCISLEERIEDALCNHRWIQTKCEDGCNYLTFHRTIFWDNDDKVASPRRHGFGVLIKGESFYVQDIFLNDEWMKEHSIMQCTHDRYDLYRRDTYKEAALVILYMAFLFTDWLYFDFALSEELISLLCAGLPRAEIVMFSHFVNPLRLLLLLAAAMALHISIFVEVMTILLNFTHTALLMPADACLSFLNDFFL